MTRRVGRRSLLALALAAVAGAAVLDLAGSTAFRPYFGPIGPVPGTVAVALLGIAALRFLESGGWLHVDRPARGKARFTLPALLATALAIPVIVVDALGGFPEDLNVLPPESLLFYPVIALVAEVVFHVAPVAILLAAATRLARGPSRRTVLTACLVAAALPEPVFQVLAGWADASPWVSAYVALHLTVFNLLAVHLFDRNGFLSMLGFRLCYYLLWHIGWGALRLHILF